jgi:hypothetical protein
VKFYGFLTSCGNIGSISIPIKLEFSYLFDKTNNHVPGPHLNNLNNFSYKYSYLKIHQDIWNVYLGDIIYPISKTFPPLINLSSIGEEKLL